MTDTEDDDDFFSIDPNQLDKEWFAQPKRMRRLCILLAEARRTRDELRAAEKITEEDLKAVAARLDLAVRKDPAGFGLEKITEGAVDKTVILQPDYHKAQEAVRKAGKRSILATYDVGVAEAAVKAAEHKRDALESAVKLHGMGYFAAPRASAEDHKAMDKKADDRAFTRGNRA